MERLAEWRRCHLRFQARLAGVPELESGADRSSLRVQAISELEDLIAELDFSGADLSDELELSDAVVPSDGASPGIISEPGSSSGIVRGPEIISELGSSSGIAGGRAELGLKFNVSIRKSDGGSCGVYVTHDEASGRMIVDEVIPDGAIAAWNRLSEQPGSRTAGKSVKPGDEITEVNRISGDFKAMMTEIEDRAFLNFTIQKLPSSPMRADANAFVMSNRYHVSSAFQ